MLALVHNISTSSGSRNCKLKGMSPCTVWLCGPMGHVKGWGVDTSATLNQRQHYEFQLQLTATAASSCAQHPSTSINVTELLPRPKLPLAG